jgi:hypothetical protein
MCTGARAKKQSYLAIVKEYMNDPCALKAYQAEALSLCPTGYIPSVPYYLRLQAQVL